MIRRSVLCFLLLFSCSSLFADDLDGLDSLDAIELPSLFADPLSHFLEARLDALLLYAAYFLSSEPARVH